MNKQTQNELLKIVRQNYDQIAEQYNETRKKHLEPLWGHLLEYAAKIVPDSRVLDIGCGNGRLLEAFAGKPIRYLGVDQNEKLIELARQNKPGFSFQAADVLALGDLPDKDFDFVFSVAVFHHLPGREQRLQALRQIKNKLAPEGQAYLTVWNMWSAVWQKKRFRWLICKFWLLKLVGKNRMDFGDILFDWKNPAGQIISRRYYHAFIAWELKRLIKSAGLKIEKFDKDEYNYYVVLKK